MKINIRINSTKNEWDFGEVVLPDNVTVMECTLIMGERYPELGIPDCIKGDDDCVVDINTHVAYFDSVLKDGDRLTIFPLVVAG